MLCEPTIDKILMYEQRSS